MYHSIRRKIIVLSPSFFFKQKTAYVIRLSLVGLEICIIVILKTRLSDYGIKESDLDALVEPIDRMGWKLGEYGNINSKVAKEILLLRL